MTLKKSVSFLSLVLCISILFGCMNTPVEKSGGEAFSMEFIMNTFVEQRWYGKNAQMACDEINSELKALESKLSLFASDSEISRLNAAAGKQPVALSDESYQLLRESALYCEQSGGLFDITIAPLTLVWNVTSEAPRIPSEQDISAAQSLVNYKDIIFDDSAKTVMLARGGMSIDLGGIAKGYAAGKMRQTAQKYGVQGFLSVGGNMMVEGKKPDKTDFLVGIRDPRGDQTEFIASVSLDGFTMATTGDYERYFEQDGVRYHHVIDPFTGYPSATDLISVSVISQNGALADCLSTSIFLQGSEGLERFLNRDDCMIVAVTRDFDVYASPALEKRLTINKAKTAYSFHF